MEALPNKSQACPNKLHVFVCVVLAGSGFPFSAFDNVSNAMSALAADRRPPEANFAYKKKGEESSGVTQMIDNDDVDLDIPKNNPTTYVRINHDYSEVCTYVRCNTLYRIL